MVAVEILVLAPTVPLIVQGTGFDRYEEPNPLYGDWKLSLCSFDNSSYSKLSP